MLKEIVSMLTSFLSPTPSRARLFDGILLLCLLALAPLTVQAQGGASTRLYVKAGASGDGSGSSWTNACATLSAALGKASTSGGAEIWVASGLYPEAVSLTTGTLLYGGFDGTETSLTQRVAGSRASILDASAANAGKPAPHVVSIQNAGNIRLDGFTLRGAQGDTTATELTNGGGLFCSGGNETVLITNCTITSNSATGDGGGVFFWESSAILENCSVTGNQALYGGGVSCTRNSSAQILNCVIVGNVAQDSGGGVSCWESSPVIAQSVISGNRSIKEGTPGIGGGGVYCTGASPRIENNLITGNFSEGDAGGLLCLNASNATIVNCVISSNISKRNGGGLFCKEGSSPKIVNSVFTRNSKYAMFVFDTPSSPLVLNNLLRENTPGDYYDLGLVESDQTSASAINLNVPGASGNVAGDPKFVMDEAEGVSGTWTTAPALNADTRTTSLTDSAAHFVPGALAGRLLVTSATLPNQALILNNTTTTLELFGDATDWTTAGCRYQLVDYRLTSGSACVDQGTSQNAPLTSLDGVYRPVEIAGQGTDGSGSAYDIGAYEMRKQYDLFVLPFGNVLDFGERDWKAGPYNAEITLISNGYDPLNFQTTTPLQLSGPNVGDFSIVNTVDTATTFTVGEARIVQIRFTPSVRRSREALLTVTTNDTDKSPLDIQIKGYALPPTPKALDLMAEDDTGVSSTDNITRLTSGLTVKGQTDPDVRVRLKEGDTVLVEDTASSFTTQGFDIALADGVHTLTACAVDEADVETPASEPLTIVVDSTPPFITSIAPSETGPTSSTAVDFVVQFDSDVVGFDSASDLTVFVTGTTTISALSVTTNTASQYTVRVTGISGTGGLVLSVKAGVCESVSGLPNLASGSSPEVWIDNSVPELLPEPAWTSGTANLIRWTPLERVTSYTLQVSATANFSDGVSDLILDPFEDNRLVENLSDGVKYFYRLRAQKGPHFSTPWSNVVSSSQDATLPTGTLILADGALYASTVTLPVKLTAQDQGTTPSGIASMRFNDGSGWSAPEPFSPTRTVTLSPENGMRTLEVRFLDVAGNESDPIQSTITLDTQTPNPVAEVLDGGAWTTTSSLTFTWLAAEDNGPAGVDSYHLQVGTTPGASDVLDEWVGNALTKTLPAPADGQYFARVQVRDRAGNLSAFSPSSDGIGVDTILPVTGVASSPRYANTRPIPVVYTGASDSGSGLREVRLWYRQGAQEWKASDTTGATTSATLAFMPPTANTTYSLCVVATDVAGNRSALPTGDGDTTVTYDTIQPAVTEVTPETTGPTHADSIAFTVRFSEPVTGFSEAGDVTVRHDPASDTTHTGVVIAEQNASTYRVTVQNLAGKGGFTLAVNPSSCLDLSGNGNMASSESLSVQIDNTRPFFQPEPRWTSGTQNTVTWSPVVNADTYPLQISDSADFTSPVLSVEATSVTTSYTFDNLTDGVTYWYRVRVHKTTGFLSEWSDPTSSTQDNGFPTGTLQINGGAPYTGSTTVTLQIAWLDPGIQPSGVTHMRLNDGAGWSEWEPTTATRTWNLSAGDGERTVLAEFRDGVDNVSTTATQALIWLDTVNPEIPGTPVDQGLYSRTGHLTFTWSAPSDGEGSGVAYYRYEITSGPNFSSATLVTTGTVTQPTLNFDGMSGVTYYCRVQAVDHAENGGPVSLPSDGILVDTLAPTTPGTPGDEGEFSSSTLLTFQWLPSTDPGLSGIEAYHYEIATSPLFPTSTLVTSGTTVLTTATCNVLQDKTYYCRVRALDRAGNQSPYSPASNGILVDTQYPTVVHIIPANVGPTYATRIDFAVAFDSPVWGFDSAEDVQIVHTGTQHTTVTLTSLSETTYTVTVSGLTGAGSFTLAVVGGAALDRAGNPVIASAPSQPVILAEAPSAPEGLAASDGLYADRVEVTWTPGISESYYRVFRSEAPSDPNPVAVSPWQQANVFDDTTVESARTYYYWVRTAIDANGALASNLGTGDSGWASGTILTDYQILYKNCSVEVANDDRVLVTQLGARSSIKIKKLKNGAGGLVDREGMRILTTSAVPRMGVAGSLEQFYCEAPIKELEVLGTLKNLTTKNSYIERLSVQGFGSLKISSAPNSTHLTAPQVGRMTLEATGTSPWPGKISLTGVTLETLNAPQHAIKSLTISSKKTNRNAYGLPYVSFGGIGSGSFVAAELLSLSVKGGGIEAPSVELTANQKPVKISTRSGAYSMGGNGILPIFRPAHVLGSLYVTAPQFTLTTQGGDVCSEMIVVSGEIKQLKANYVRAWTNRGLVAQGGHLGVLQGETASTTRSLFVSGTGMGASRNIESAFGALGVQGIFVAGAELTPDGLYPVAPNCQGTITSIGCNGVNPTVYPLPHIAGESWSSAAKPIQFKGDKGTTGIPAGFRVFTENDLPFPKP